MFPLGFFFVAGAAYLIDCAIKNRSPIATLEKIIADPKNMRTILSSSAGSGYQSTVRNDSGIAANSTGGYGGTSGTAGLNDLLHTGIAEPSGSAKALQALALARTQIGKPYHWGAAGPNAYDCSGLMYWAYKYAGVNIPRVTTAQLVAGRAVTRAQLAPGDLIFPSVDHVYMYAGNGNIVEAAHTGTNVHEVPLYAFWKARRFA